MVFKVATVDNYTTIAELHADSWKRTYRGIYSEDFLNFQVEEDRKALWLNRLSFPKQNQHVILAEEHKQIIGFACIFLDHDAQFGTLLDNLHVKNNLQKRGVGRLLMQQCGKIILQSTPNKKMYLWVYEKNINALAFYDKMNGIKIETVPHRNDDGTFAPACRYAWANIEVI